MATLTALRRPSTLLMLRRFAHADRLNYNLLFLRERGLIETLLPNNSDSYFRSAFNRPRTLYCGFDPTADSLHLGNLLSCVLMMHALRRRHRVIALVGGATAAVGDPSGRATERDCMDAETLVANTAGVKETLNRIFNNHLQMVEKKGLKGREVGEFLIVDNADWSSGFSASDLASGIGAHLRLSDLLSKESVERRLSSQQGMSVKEFLYPLFQANDWLHLFRNFNCILQLGGNDQQGNIDVGRTLIRQATGQHVFGLTVPLLTTADGHKIGKSDRDGVMWLSEAKTPAFALYQHLLNTSDKDVLRLLRLFTFLKMEEIEHIQEKQEKEPETRFAQRRLAEEVITLVHGLEALSRAKLTTSLLFGDESENVCRAVSQLSGPELPRLGVPTAYIALRPDVSLLQAVMATAYPAGEAEALAWIRQGAVQVNQQKVTRPEMLMRYGIEILPNNVTVVKIGKKRFCLLIWFD